MSSLSVDEDSNQDKVDVLALFINPKVDDDGDEALITALEVVIDGGYEAFGLNDSMEKVRLDAEPEPEAPAPTPEPEPEPVAQQVSKSAKKKAVVVEPVAVEPAVTDIPVSDAPSLAEYTRAELEGLTPAEIKAIAQGINVTGKSKKEYIEGILASQSGTPAPSVTPPVTSTFPMTNVTMGTPTTFTTTNSTYAIPDSMVLVVIHGPAGITVKHLPWDAVKDL